MGQEGGVPEAQIPRILRKPEEPEYPIFVELFFDLAYIFIFLRLSEILVSAESVETVAQAAVMLLAGWWVWVLTAWLTDLFDPRLPIIQNLVTVTAVGVTVMAAAMRGAFHGRGLVFVLAYFAIHLARDAVLIPGTRVNRDIQARSIRVFFWFGVGAVLWLAGALAGSRARLLLWAGAVVIDYGSARIGWPTPGYGRTNLGSRIFTAPHLAERHRQIVIVAFGELILTSSTGLDTGGFAVTRVAAFALSLGSAVLLFQLYLEQVRSLEQPEAAVTVEHIRPGTFASYWHLVMVAGVVCISAGARTVAAHPDAHVPLIRTLIILAGPTLFLFGTCLFDLSVTSRISWPRVLSALAAYAATPAFYLRPSWTIMLTVDAVLALALIVELAIKRLSLGRTRPSPPLPRMGHYGAVQGSGSRAEQEMTVPVTPPSQEDIAAIASRYGLGLGPRDVAELRALIAGALASYDVVERLHAQRQARAPEPPARAWRRPAEAANKLGAWYVTTDVAGAGAGPLAGRRVAVKDNIAVAGVPMMNGSATVEGFIPRRDATVVTRLLAAGATIAGKAVCEELCFDGGSHTSATGPVRNPWDRSKSTGGSSSGSAALVAAGEVDMALGGLSDGLPAGLMIVGRQLADAVCLRVAQAYEAAIGGFPAPPGAARD
jgi:low temperature requirement protein LtrA